MKEDTNQYDKTFKILESSFKKNSSIFSVNNVKDFLFLTGNVARSMIFNDREKINEQDIKDFLNCKTIANLKLQFDYLQGVYGNTKKINRNRNYLLLCVAVASYSDPENEVIKKDDLEYLKNGLFWNDLLLYS
ncbi:hypothetical protein BMJ45_04135 [Listeria monocytogenes]|nr:hypothetical protein [Listeria monocytogenes]